MSIQSFDSIKSFINIFTAVGSPLKFNKSFVFIYAKFISEAVKTILKNKNKIIMYLKIWKLILVLKGKSQWNFPIIAYLAMNQTYFQPLTTRDSWDSTLVGLSTLVVFFRLWNNGTLISPSSLCPTMINVDKSTIWIFWNSLCYPPRSIIICFDDVIK